MDARILNPEFGPLASGLATLGAEQATPDVMLSLAINVPAVTVGGASVSALQLVPRASEASPMAGQAHSMVPPPSAWLSFGSLMRSTTAGPRYSLSELGFRFPDKRVDLRFPLR
jgi:hypothetical protein